MNGRKLVLPFAYRRNLKYTSPRSSQKAEVFQDGPLHRSSNRAFSPEPEIENPTIDALRRQNHELIEALLKIQKAHMTEKKRFHEILFGVDKALSSLPIRLEKIRVRNQKNLSIINTSRFYLEDGSENAPEPSTYESTLSDEYATVTSEDSQYYLSSRMKCLLRKMDQLNDLIHTIKNGDSAPIELLVNSELYAISLLKKEIKSTKKQIENNRTDSGSVTSCEGSHKELVEDSSSKAKNSFSNELNKASNFKIFENHMILQEEALHLLTRKIRKTEEALVKEVEAKECLRRENEAMAKEIFRLKSMGEESKGEKSEKMEKLKAEAEATGNRPYRLIKELKTKLEEKEKSLIAWKSKCARLEAVGSNKTILIEIEKKKNFELETTVKNLRVQNKSLTSHLNSVQFLNEQLRDQIEILKHQVEVLANERMELELNSVTRNRKIDGQMSELGDFFQTQESQVEKVGKSAGDKIKEVKLQYRTEVEETKFLLVRSQKMNEEFSETFKELLIRIHTFSMENEIKSINHPSHDRIREILHITSSDLKLLYSVYIKSTNEKEVEKSFEEFKSIVDGVNNEFSKALSTWFFDIIRKKLLHQCTREGNVAEE